jgi:alpha-D-xyloside xylohydrolase
MLGDSLLVAPVMNDAGIAEFYLPGGVWTDIVTGEVYPGGRYHKRICSYTEMPVLARENSIIGFGRFAGSFDYDFLEGAEFVLYCPADGAACHAVVYDNRGENPVTITASRTGNSVAVSATHTDKAFGVRLSGSETFHGIGAEGVTIAACGSL